MSDVLCQSWGQDECDEGPTVDGDDLGSSLGWTEGECHVKENETEEGRPKEQVRDSQVRREAAEEIPWEDQGM